PAVAKKQKRDALNVFGDKLTDLMNTNPILKVIAAHADLYSFAATALCVLFTIIALLTSNGRDSGKTVNFGGEVGGCFIFSILAVIFGGFSLCKKKVLPLTVSMTSIGILMFVRFIVNIVTFATYGSAAVGSIINFVFMILEMGGIGYLTYICWTYLLAALPPKAVMQQIYQQSYASQQQNNTQQAAYQQPTVPQQTQTVASQTSVPAAAAVTAAAPTASPAPVFAPQQSAPIRSETASANRICPNCQAVNSNDSLFCQKCGTKLV
ncbi:MAG: zinc ribbon domain-containing protein, partial [Ruminiclostridium sp.]|nr:zinc ribbon domain-containing protein [Ruminiclostridium sp.]